MFMDCKDNHNLGLTPCSLVHIYTPFEEHAFSHIHRRREHILSCRWKHYVRYFIM